MSVLRITRCFVPIVQTLEIAHEAINMAGYQLSYWIVSVKSASLEAFEFWNSSQTAIQLNGQWQKRGQQAAEKVSDYAGPRHWHDILEAGTKACWLGASTCLRQWPTFSHVQQPKKPLGKWWWWWWYDDDDDDDDDDDEDDDGLWEVVGLTLRRSKKEEHPVCLNVQYLSCNCCLSRGKSSGLKSM